MRIYPTPGPDHADTDRDTARNAPHPEADRHIRRPYGHPALDPDWDRLRNAPHPEADRHIRRPYGHPALDPDRDRSRNAPHPEADRHIRRPYGNNTGFREEDHPRDSDGKFTETGGGGGTKETASPGADGREALLSAAGLATEGDIAAMEHSDEETRANSEYMKTLRADVRGKISRHAPEAGHFLLGMLDGMSETSGEITRLLQDIASGMIYNMTRGALGGKDSYEAMQAMTGEVLAIPWKAFTGEMSDDSRRELNAAMRRLNQASTPRETGKALIDSVGVLAALFGPEFAANRLASARSVLMERRIVYFDGRFHITTRKKDIGMETGGNINLQGLPYEHYRIKKLRKKSPTVQKLPVNFPAYDAYDPATKTAYSIKTLDTETVSRIGNPRELHSALKSYINKMVNFEKGEKVGFRLKRSDIVTRKLECAVPSSATNKQLAIVAEIMEYAARHGVEVHIDFVR